MPTYQADSVAVPVFPSFRDFGKQMDQGTLAAAKKSGASAGKAFSTSFNSGAADSAKVYEATEKRVATAVKAASKAVETARVQEEDATRKARIEELKLQELRDKGKATAAQLATAEDRLIKAQRGLAGAQKNSTQAAQDYDDALEKGNRELKDARVEAEKTGQSYKTLGGRIKDAVSTGSGKAFSGISRGAKREGQTSGKAFGSAFGLSVKGALGVATVALGALKGLTAGADFARDSIGEAREAQKVGAVTTQIIKATGRAAKVSADDVGVLTTAISNKTGVDDEAIQSGSNLLLTFKNVRNEAGAGAKIFDRATAAAVDLSKAGFGSIEGSSKMLGKALNDPLKGISALSRAGVTFTQQQKDQIKTLVASGRTLDAQKIILKEVEGQVGGVAAKSSTAGEKLKVTFDNLKEGIGTAFLPLLDKAQTSIATRLLPAITDRLVPALPSLVHGLETVGTVFESVGKIAVSAFGGSVAGNVGILKNGISGLGDYLATHQADFVGFFVKAADGALSFAEGLVTTVQSGLRGYATLARATADMAESSLGSFKTILDASVISFGWIPGIGDKLKDSQGKFDTFATTAIGSLRKSADGADDLADGFDKTVLPALDRTRKSLKKTGDTEVFKAKQRDSAERAAAAIRKISGASGSAQIQLKKFSDISKLSADKQDALRGRLAAAKNALGDQLVAARRAGAGQKELTKTWEAGKKKLYDEFVQMGLSKKEAQKLADKYAGIKPKVSTKIEQPGMKKARDDTKDLDDRINALSNKKVTISFATNASFKGFKVNLTSPSAVGRLARGGTVQGVGGPREDNVMGIDPHTGRHTADVSVGEEVIKERSARANRAALKAINAGDGKRFEVHPVGRYAAGGTVRRKIVNGFDANLDPLANAVTAVGKGVDRWANQEGQRIGKVIGKKMADAAEKAAGASAGTINVNNPRGLTTYRGGRFTNLFAANLRRAEKLAKETLRVFQGGFRPSTSYSGTSHAGDAVDAQPSANMIRGLRRVGIASGDRTGLGNWVGHSHSVPTKGAGFGGGSATYQAQDYLRRGGAKQSIRSPWGLKDGGTVRAGLYDTGGILQPGLTLAMNGTGRPETIRTEVQERALQTTTNGPSNVFNISGPDANQVARKIQFDQGVSETMAAIGNWGGG